LSLLPISSRKGPDSALHIWQSLKKLWGGRVNHHNGIRSRGTLTCGVFEWIGSRIQYFIVKFWALFKYWPLLIIVDAHSIGWEGSNTALHPTAHRYAVRGG
jgi:hypothetical protein